VTFAVLPAEVLQGATSEVLNLDVILKPVVSQRKRTQIMLLIAETYV